MKLNISNEFGSLKSAVVCWGENIPLYKTYKTDDPEFTKYHPYSWDKDLLLGQQEKFFNLLEKYRVKLIFPETYSQLIWQMYTRDTAFVVGEKLYYSKARKLKARSGEVDSLLEALSLSDDQKVPLETEIEGGDVLVIGNRSIYLGLGSRTSSEAVKMLSKSLDVKPFELGDNVMHLDTRLTILPKNIALVNVAAFDKQSLKFILANYTPIEVFDQETKKLGTNVLVINPETVIVPKQNKRVAKELEAKGLKVELVDYTEPINLGGSFRCTTMPVERAN